MGYLTVPINSTTSENLLASLLSERRTADHYRLPTGAFGQIIIYLLLEKIRQILSDILKKNEMTAASPHGLKF